MDGLIKLWDVASRAELAVFRGHNAWVNETAFFPDGRTLASVSDDRTIKFWDTSFLADSTMLKGQAGPATDFHFLPDGKSLAILAPDGNLSFWDVASGRQTGQLAGRFKGFSDSGRLLLGERASGEIELWDNVTRQAIATIREQKGSPSTAAFSPDDKFLACTDREGTLRVWEVATGRLQRTLLGSAQFVEELWFPDGADDSVLGIRRSSEAFQFWDLQAGREMGVLPKSVGRVRQTYENGLSLSLVHDGLGRARVESSAMPTNYTTRLISFLPVSDGKMIIVGGERDITLWDIGTGRRLATLEGHGGWVRGLALSPDGRVLASAANDGKLKLWNLALRKEVITLPGQIAPWTRKLAFAPDGNSIAALSAEEDRLVRFFHSPSLKEIDEAEAGNKATKSPR